MTQPIKKNYRSGLSLVELAVVLTILGVIAYGTVSAGMLQVEMANQKKLAFKLDKIDEAITLYFKTYGYLPCPADGRIALGNSNYGTETSSNYGGGGVSASTHQGLNSDAVINSQCRSASNGHGIIVSGHSPRIFHGVVPVTTLGLPPDFMFDNNDNRITYAVSVPCVAPDNWQNPSSTHVNKFKCSLDGAKTGSKAVPNATNGAKITITDYEAGQAAYVVLANDDNPDAYTRGGFHSNYPYFTTVPSAYPDTATTRWRTAAQIYYDATH